MNIADLMLNYAITVLSTIYYVVPPAVCLIAMWRVSRLRNLTNENYQDKANESIADTLKEQISDRFLQPFLDQLGIQLPHGTQPADLLERLVQHDPNNVTLLTTIFQSLQTAAQDSPYFQQILFLIFGGG